MLYTLVAAEAAARLYIVRASYSVMGAVACQAFSANALCVVYMYGCRKEAHTEKKATAEGSKLPAFPFPNTRR